MLKLLDWQSKLPIKQSSEVDLLSKSEVFNGTATVCEATGITLLGIYGASPPYPRGNLEKWKYR